MTLLPSPVLYQRHLTLRMQSQNKRSKQSLISQRERATALSAAAECAGRGGARSGSSSLPQAIMSRLAPWNWPRSDGMKWEKPEIASLAQALESPSCQADSIYVHKH